MEKYKFTEKKILIYGAGSIGQLITDVLEKEQLKVAGYIDKRADNVKMCRGKCVWGVDEVQEAIRDKDDYVIIITIRNVFEHVALAEHFWDMGFNNIIYKPKVCLEGYSEPVQDSINFAYEDLLGKFVVPKEPIACFEKESLIIRDHALQKELQDELLVRIPAELLFSNYQADLSVWSYQNFYSDYVAVDLYSAFGNADKSKVGDAVEKYVQRFALPGARLRGVNTEGEWEKILIDSRQRVYYEMEYKLWMDYGFFLQNTTKVELKGKSAFVLIASGKNRVSFLIAKGFRYIPVRMKKQEYEHFLNKEVAEKVGNYLHAHGCELLASIPHPFFYRENVVAPDYAAECIKPIARFLAEQVYLEKKKYCFDEYKLSIAINDEGCMGRYFRMLGYGVNRLVEKNQTFCSLLDSLFRFSEDDFVNSGEGAYCAIVSDEMPEVIRKEIVSIESTFLIVIYFNGLLEENIVDFSRFSYYEDLFCVIWGGKKIQCRAYRIKKSEGIIV